MCGYDNKIFTHVLGMKIDELKNIIPSELDMACHNSSDNFTISGPKDIVEPFLKTLHEKGIYAKAIFTQNIAAHSRYLRNIGPSLQQFAKSVGTKTLLIHERRLESNYIHLWQNRKIICFFNIDIDIYRIRNINIMKETQYRYFQKYQYFCPPLF